MGASCAKGAASSADSETRGDSGRFGESGAPDSVRKAGLVERSSGSTQGAPPAKSQEKTTPMRVLPVGGGQRHSEGAGIEKSYFFPDSNNVGNNGGVALKKWVSESNISQGGAKVKGKVQVGAASQRRS